MKIGFSFGRCVGSIVKGEVDINDVMLIVARTYIESEDAVDHVIQHYQYTPGYLMGLDIDKCLEVGLELWRSGKLIQPRANGVRVLQVPTDYIWMDLFPTTVANSDAVKIAWNTYRFLLGLTEQLPDPDGEVLLQHGSKQ